ncbi:Bug family tripartite tricarboxylate transporter substrate binding protein [Paraburkholderia xenovorans]
MLAKQLTTKFPDAHIVVEDRTGANGAIAAAATAHAPADGHTLFFITKSTVNLKYLYKKLAFNIDTDFQPVAKMMTMPNVLIVGPSIKVADYPAFVAHVKSAPGQLTSFSTGVGSDPHLALAGFTQKTGLNIRHIPYTGASNALIDMYAGRIDVSFATLATAMPPISKGNVRPLAIGGDTRNTLLPNVPTFKELGVEGFSPQTWFGVIAPKGTPMPIVEKLNAAIREVMNTPEGVKLLATLGSVPANQSVGDFTKDFREDIADSGALIHSLGIQPQ